MELARVSESGSANIDEVELPSCAHEVAPSSRGPTRGSSGRACPVASLPEPGDHRVDLDGVDVPPRA